MVLRMERNQDSYVQLQPATMRPDSDVLFSPGFGIMGSLGLPQSNIMGFENSVPLKANDIWDESSTSKKGQENIQRK